MIPQRWQQISDLLHEAMQLDPEQRSNFLQKLSATDPELGRELKSLLDAHDNADSSFLQGVGTEKSQSKISGERSAIAGQRFGDYRIIEQIGEGGMGEVYRAVRDDDQFCKEVAIKVVRAGQDSGLVISRFRNERQILASLDHPNIARLLDGGTTDEGVPFFVMELIRGEAIDQYCNHHNLSIHDRLELFLQVCSAVQFAHQRLIIHRDIKPGNILVTAEGVPKLLDFGIAKILNKEESTGQFEATVTVVRMLTPAYASPEQVKGEPITTASDVYSLGVVLYELLTGRHPYRRPDSTTDEIARAVSEMEPEKPSTAVRKMRSESAGAQPSGRSSEKLSKQLQGDLDNIILMALRKEPQRRYVSAEQLAADIRLHLGNLPVVARKDTVRYRVSKFVARHKPSVAAAALVVLTLIAALIITLHEAHVARMQQARAEARFNDVRKLANSFMFDFDRAIQNIPGTTHAREMLVKTALQYLDSLNKESHGDPSLQNELASAYENVGDIQGLLAAQNLGNTAGALDSYRKALTIRESLVKADPGNALAKKKLAYTYGGVGRMLGQMNDFPGALENARKMAEIYDRLAAANPTDAVAARDQAGSYERLAYTFTLSGDFPQSVANHRRAISILEKLASAKPDDQDLQFALAQAYRLTSVALRHVQDTKGALEVTEKAIAISERIAESAPNNVRAKLDLAFGYGELGTVYDNSENLRQALEIWQKALQLEEPVAAADPNDTRAKILLGDAYAQVNLHQIKLGMTTDEAGLLKSLEIRRQLLASNPDNNGRKEVVANTIEMIGDAERALASNTRFPHSARQQHWHNARNQYKQALDIYLALRAQGALRGQDADHPDNLTRAIGQCDAELSGKHASSSPTIATTKSN